jgi:signal transduction histidine kinase/CheY-like chemotaxis protein
MTTNQLDLPELTTAEREAALAPIRARADRWIGALVAVHFVLAFVLAGAYDTWAIAGIVAPLAAGLHFAVGRLAPNTGTARIATGIALQSFCALHIFQYHGLAEQHFWFFTSTTAMIAYQDPRAAWPGVVLIILQHALFAVLHNSGVDLRFFEGEVGVAKLVFHFGIALVQTLLCAWMAGELRARTLQGAAMTKAVETARKVAVDAARQRGAFLANMSHEIRSPMNGIEGMADLLLRSHLDREQRESIETIRASSHALLSVIGDVLDLAKIESDTFVVRQEPFDVGRVAREVVRLLGTRAADAGTSLAVHVGSDVPPAVIGDPDRVRQVLVNLVGNAVKFTKDGRVDVFVRGGAERIVLEVVDTGIGIAHEDQQRIFEPFEQADSSTTRRFGGTGLGLAITRRLVALMGGRIELASLVGSGSTFTVELPLAVHQGAPPALTIDDVAPLAPNRGGSGESAPVAMLSQATGAAPRAPEHATAARGLHVLVVEDTEVNVVVVTRMLAKLGHTSVVARDGAQGLAALERERFDLVLMDCQMPVLCGTDACARWRAIEASEGRERTPIIALTANALARDRDACLAAGMDGWLTKPITLAVLERELAALGARVSQPAR